MRRRLWLTLDRLGHALPLRRFGRARYAVCLRADRFYSFDDDMTPEHFDALAANGEPVELTSTPKVTFVSSTIPGSLPPVNVSTGTSATATFTESSGWTWTYR